MGQNVRRFASACLIVLVAPIGGMAQTIRGVVTDATRGEPLAGAWLEVVDLSGARVAAGLSRADGSYELGANGGAALVVAYIGYDERRLALGSARATDTLFVDVGLSVRPVSLEGLEVVGEERCRGDEFRAAGAARVWDDARNALEVADWTVDEQRFRYEIERYVRRLDEDAFQVVSEDRTRVPGWGVHPFESPEPRVLAEGGYVQRVDGETVYYAPDVEALLSDDFLRTHCFTVVVGADDHEGDVGLSFRPTPDRRVPDIMGELWLDASTSRLKSVEYRYVGLERDFDTSMLGGRVSFRVVEEGGWIVDRWWIRMPVIGIQQAIGTTTARRIVVGIEEVGGEVLRLGPVEEVATLAGPPTVVEGRVLEEVSEAPVPDATVRLTGTPYVARTGADGSFAIRGIRAGIYRVGVHHTSLTRLGQDTVRALLTVSQEHPEELVVRIPSELSVLARRCSRNEETRPDGWTIVTGTVVDRRSGVPVPDARVRASWSEVWRVDRTGFAGRRPWREVSTDGGGRYVLCDVPAPGQVEVTASFLGVTERVTLNVEPGVVRDTTFALPLGGSRSW